MRLSALWRPRARSPRRIYAIGDIHGRGDLLAELLRRIEIDLADRTAMAPLLIVLGDFVDRGPDSARIVDLLVRLHRNPNVVVLKGNHEATMVSAIDGDAAAMEAWLAFGGKATLASYGVDVADEKLFDLRAFTQMARQAVPGSVLDWMRRLPTSHRIGHYFFTHAGIRPGVPLHKQTEDDLLWIRSDFTDSRVDHGVTVVHGHTVEEAGIYFGPNRIGVDTGAYRTGRLSAVGIEGQRRWVVQTDPGGPLPA